MTIRSARARVKKAVGGVLAVLVAAAMTVGAAVPAHAAGGTVSVVLPDVAEHNGMPVYESGREYALQIGYGAMDDGKVATVEVPAGVTIPASALVIPAGNTAVESLALDADGNIVVTFADPFPADINQGVLDLKFVVDVVEEAQEVEHVWRYDGEETRLTVLVTRPGETPQTVRNGFDKRAGSSSLPTVTVVDGQVVLGADVLTAEFPFTLTLDSADARSAVIADQLGDYLTLVPGSLQGTKDVYDANGLNKTTSDVDGLPAISGTGFEFTVDAEAHSRYTFTYLAKIDEAAVDALRDELQARYEEVADAEDGGNYTVRLGNTATLDGGDAKTAGRDIGGRVNAQPRPDLGRAFGKSTSRPGDLPVTFAADGVTLDPAIDVDYTLRADLTPFAAFGGTRHELTRNVVVTDTLPAQTEWVTGAGFLASTGMTLTEVSGVSAVDFAGDAYVGTYLLDGDTLRINVGKDTTTSVSVTVKARIVSVEGLTRSTASWETPPTAAAVYNGLGNTARFAYSETGDPVSRSVGHRPLERKDTSEGVVDPEVFRKAGPAATVNGRPGDAIDVPFTFTVGNGVGDITSSVIVDHVDHDVFDVTAANLDEISAGVALRYEWFPENQLGWNGFALDPSFWSLALTDDGDLEFSVTDAFAAALSELGIRNDANFTVTITLPTKPVTGKQSLEIVNKASYRGADTGYVYTSSASSRATTFGNEMEVRKRIYDGRTDAYTNNLRAELDADGNLVGDRFVYRVDLIAHGSFSAMVRDVVDVLPAGVEFLGFVNPGDVATGEVAATDEYTIPGTALRAQFAADTNTLTVERGRLTQGQEATLHFAIRIADFEPGMGITNVIDGTRATITPTNDYPLDISKLDASDTTVVIDDAAARFQVLGSDDEGRADLSDVVLDRLRVVDGKLRTAEGAMPMVTEPGTYWVRELTAPAGYLRTDTLTRVTVGADGSSAEVRVFNEPGEDAPKTYAIGDLVWVDTHRDDDPSAHGDQGEGEFLDGVIVKLFQQDGDAWTEVAETVTSGGGRYLFDELPAGVYRVQFILTDEQAERYEFTTPLAEGVDPAENSDAGENGFSGDIVLDDTNTALTRDYSDQEFTATEGIDPTWDAGVVVKKEPVEPRTPRVSVGDFVWVDVNRDGRQDAGEPGIPGVVLELVGPDGAVTDVDGSPVGTVTTGPDGGYLFENLPVLEEGQRYTVRIVRDHPSTIEALRPYVPTREGQGDTAGDSSTWSATTVEALTEDGDHDPSLDFGFVTKTYAIGDYVWIDADRDGIQGDDEKPLAGVTVVLLDSDGEFVAETTTDERGRYLFDELPAGTYQVRFELTDEQAKVYAFSRTGAGDTGGDSDADPRTGLTRTIVLNDENAHLTDEYAHFPVSATQGIDPTWDAGVVLRDAGGEEPGGEEPGGEEPGGEEPGGEEPGTEEPGGEEPGTEQPGSEEPGSDGSDDPDGLASSGGEFPWAPAVAGLLLLAGGGLLLVRRRAAA